MGVSKRLVIGERSGVCQKVSNFSILLLAGNCAGQSMLTIQIHNFLRCGVINNVIYKA